MRYLLLLIIIFSQLNSRAQSLAFNNKTKIYLVRHAEKQTGEDPLLTKEGNKRAGDLMRALKDKKIRRIYVTEYKRTQNTGDSLRIQSGIDTVHYLSDTSCIDLLKKIKMNKDIHRAILIIGHSNTIPVIIRKLGITAYPVANIPDSEFDNLFLVRFKKSMPYVVKVKYGASSGESATMK